MALDLGTAGVGLAAGVASGLLVPGLIAGLPDPEPEEGEPPVSYRELADVPGLGWRAAAVGGGCGALAGPALGWSPLLLVWLPLGPVFVALGYVDWRTRLLPRLLVLPATAYLVVVVAAIVVTTGDTDLGLRALAGLLAARAVFWVMWWLHSAGMGFGDVRLAALLGGALAAVGWAEAAVGIYAGFLLFGVPLLALALWRRDRRELRVARPYGPFMLAGALVGLVVGDPLAALLVN